MTTRDAFLNAHGWGEAKAVALAGDASSRCYERLRLGDNTAILMLAPPEDRTAFDNFLRIGAQLREIDLSAPEIYAADADDGLMLLEDFGDALVSKCEDLSQIVPLAADLLAHLARLGTGWDLPHMGPRRMAEMTELALGSDPQVPSLIIRMAALFETHLTQPLCPALRDFFGGNLIWLPQREGLARLGLLDFQDAVLAPPGYDLISFIHDARRDIDPQIAQTMSARYCSAMGLDPEAFETHSALLSFQRNLRIHGVFRHLAEERSKPAYLTHLPRVRGYIEAALRHPVLSDLAPEILSRLPQEAR